MKIYKLSIRGLLLTSCLLLLQQNATAQNRPDEKPLEEPTPQDVPGPWERLNPLEEDHYELTKVRIYPNPATDYITLDFGPDGSAKKVFLYDVAGNLLETRSLHTASVQINTSQLSAGVYLLYVDNKVYPFQKL